MAARKKRASGRKRAARKPPRAARRAKRSAREATRKARKPRRAPKAKRPSPRRKRGAAAPKRAAAPPRAELARRILALAPRLALADRHESIGAAAATALRNVQDTAAGARATRGSAAGSTQGAVDLAEPLLGALIALAELGYRLRVSALAGGMHRPDSPHYAGRAFSVDRLNGQAVGARHPDVGRFRDDCRRLGAIRVIGPGEPGHETEVQAVWPQAPLS